MAGEPILIVDDTPVNLKLTRILLGERGIQGVDCSQRGRGTGTPA